MDFFGMGMGEVLLILIVALLIWGPRRIVEIASMLGKAIHTLRKATSDLTATVTKELSMEEKDHPSPSRTKGDDKTKGSSDIGTTESSSTEMTGPRD